ncbi:MAG TPA: hypothetical protein VNI83_11690 [Vicinamibacterales bacterium]|nr:hypothetical protein [Vicinamibacterales bacterium]
MASRRGAVSTVLGLCAALIPGAVRAQPLPSAPISLAGGRIVLGGDLAVSVGEKDELAYFNYTDYEHNALRLVRLSVLGEWRLAERLAVLGELRSENADEPRAYALYVRVRPWRDRAVDLQAGRIPPVFGTFARRLYATDNPLIGYPLAYQYLTTLRPDAIPRTADDLLAVRARGWRVQFPVGSTAPRPGVPIVTAFRWDTGVQVHAGDRAVQLAAAVTTGTLSSPRVRDDNGGKQVAARLELRPVFGLIAGLSAARGEWLSDAVQAMLPPGARGGDYTQQAFGVDLEYSRGHWLVRGETIVSAWRLPAVASPHIDGALVARATWAEGRYRLSPRFYAAARADRLDFSRLRGTLFGGAPTTWDAPVTRFEVGGGWYVQRNVIVKLVVQRNWRDGGRQRERTFVSAQAHYWF